MSEYDLVIIGSGPAGFTAAIYAGRSDLKTLLIEGPQPGGQLTITSDIENFPGFPEAVGGAELMERMRRQAEKFGTKFLTKVVTKLDLSTRPFRVYVGEDEIVCKTLIFATGASARWLNIESETKLRGKGVSACATCDGFFFRDKDVVVVGGGDTAIEEALFLTKFAKTVSIIHRRDKLRATSVLQKRAMSNSKIRFEWNSIVKEIKDVNEDKVTGVILKDTKSDEERLLKCDGVFVAIGHVPNTDLVKERVELDSEGYVNTDGVKTNVKGVFAAGDCQDKLYWQAVTAAGSGCMAALEASKCLEEENV